MFIKSIASAFAAVLLLSSSAYGELEVTPDPENVVAKHLEGAWKMNDAISDRLNFRSRGVILTFEADSSVMEQMPEEYFEFFTDKTIYMVGTVDLSQNDRAINDIPFVLTNLNGNPHLVVFLEQGGQPWQNQESSIVMLAPGRERLDDLLFMGGDFSDDPFAAFERVERDKDVLGRPQ